MMLRPLNAAMLLEARRLEARALALEHPSEGCSDPTTAAALYRIAVLIYTYTGNTPTAGVLADRAADLKAREAEKAEEARRAAAPQKELF